MARRSPFGYDVKRLFFDSRAVTSRVDPAKRRVLSRFGAFVRTRSKSSIRKRKAASRPGAPPSSHTGLLKKFIFFSYEPQKESVVIGPEKLSGRAGRDVPEILEDGGRTVMQVIAVIDGKRKQQHAGVGIIGAGGRVKDKQGRIVRKKDVQFRHSRNAPKRKVKVAARPYMGPAFQTELDKNMPGMWKDSVR